MSSYTLDSKKRKFDRILESLTDRTTPSSKSTTSKTIDVSSNGTTTLRQELIAAAKKRRVSGLSNRSDSQGPLLTHYLPSSRAAFLERLETFRHITKWHIPSTIRINASQWARHGWICADVDTVSCPSCHERVTIDINPPVTRVEVELDEQDVTKVESQDQEMSDNLYRALVDRYNEMIVTSHAEGCSWRKRGCDDSIQRIEGLLNTNDVMQSLSKRCKDISENIKEIPETLELSAPDAMQHATPEELVETDTDFKELGAVKLAICGWQYKGVDVLECRHCFRSLGLWLYRGTAPTVECLDPVQSHLEYCPWRSPEAQTTELAVTATGEKNKVAGWALVYAAVEKHVKRKRELSGGTPKASKSGPDVNTEPLTPEEREKKRRDLLRRVKELKKPFNVSNLLGRMNRSKAHVDGKGH